jgi:hypothetical protein
MRAWDSVSFATRCSFRYVPAVGVLILAGTRKGLFLLEGREGRDIRERGGLEAAVDEADTVRVIAAIAGG